MYQCPMGASFYTIQPGDTLWGLAQRFNTTVYEISTVNPGINPNYLYIGQVICMPTHHLPFNPIESTPSTNGEFSRKEVNLINTIRKLWEEHVEWTRMTILSMTADSLDTELVTNRLLRNPSDFAEVLRPLYGNEIASRFESLFKAHLVIASELVKAAKSGDNNAAADAEKKWYTNADEIAAFLARINPNWSEDDWKRMMHEHLALTKSEAVERLHNNYAEDIRIYDQIQNQALIMADMMSKGIIKQFPSHF